MATNYAAIPTTYHGVRFRSRLEARWAAFFDLCGWSWEYEPVELRGWIPDFVITGNIHRVAVEVKPFAAFDDAAKGEIGTMMYSGWEDDLLLLGLSPSLIEPIAGDEWMRETHFTEPRLGWIGRIDQKVTHTFCDAVVGRWGDGYPGRLGFCCIHPHLGYDDRVSGRDNGEMTELYAPTVDEVAAIWTEAGNMSQWRPISQ